MVKKLDATKIYDIAESGNTNRDREKHMHPCDGVGTECRTDHSYLFPVIKTL